MDQELAKQNGQDGTLILRCTVKVKGYQELRVWQNSMRLTTKIYQITKRFPKEETYGLTAQMHRSAVSVPSNIEEGQGRASRGEFKQFLCMARGSLFELETQFLLAKRLGFVSEKEILEIEIALGDVAPVLNALIRSLNEN